MWGLSKLFHRNKKKKGAQGGAVNPAARAAAPAASPARAAPRGMLGAHREGQSQRSAQSVSASVDAAIAMAQEAIGGSAVADMPLSAPQAEAQQMQADYQGIMQSLRLVGGGGEVQTRDVIADLEAAIHDAQVATGVIREKPIMADGLMDVNEAMDSAASSLAGVTPVAAPEPIELAPAGALESYLAALTGQPVDAAQPDTNNTQESAAPEGEPVPQAEAEQGMEIAIAAMQVVGVQPMSAKVAGLIALPDLYAQSGLTEADKLPAKASAVMKALGEYHTFMDSRVITVQHYRQADEHLPEVQSLDAVIRACNAMVQGFKGRNKKSKAYAALMPGVSQLLIQAYQLMPMMAAMDKILVPYVFATGSENVSVAQLIESPQAKALMGSMSSFAEQDAAPRDGGAEAMRLYGASASKSKNAPEDNRLYEVDEDTNLPVVAGTRSGNAERDARARLFPSVDSPSFLQDAERLVKLLDDLSTKTMQLDFTTQRENMFVMRLLSQAMASPGIQAMFSADAAVASDARANPSAADAALFAQLREAAGQTVGQLSASFTDFLLSEGQITQVSSSAKSVGANLSVTYLDQEKGSVFRTAIGEGSEEENFEAQKKAFNGSYDEAMAKLDEALGLGVIANAQVTAYKDKAGKAQIGSRMDIAAGESMKNLTKTPEGQDSIDFKAPRLLESYLRLAVIDYIAMHTDRNPGNYMYNPDAPAGESVIKGIDNDMVFNMGPGNQYGQGDDYGEVVSVYSMLAERNAGQAGFGKAFKPGSDVARYRDVRAIQGRENDFRIALDSFEVITPELKDLVMQINPGKINAVLRPYVNVAARLAVLERIKELQTYISSAKVVSMHHEDGSVNQENMQEYYHAMDKNAIRGMMAGARVGLENGQLTIAMTPNDMSNKAGSTVGNQWGKSRAIALGEALPEDAQEKNDALKQYFVEHGMGMEELHRYALGTMDDYTRKEYVKLVGAQQDDFETQNAKIKAHFMAQSMDDIRMATYIPLGG